MSVRIAGRKTSTVSESSKIQRNDITKHGTLNNSIYLHCEKLYHTAKGGYSMTIPKYRLNAARVNAGMTQTEVAKTLNRNKQTIVNWENGATEIKM